jgi:cyclopropane-fatty-acyl-phospholipid synthase
LTAKDKAQRRPWSIEEGVAGFGRALSTDEDIVQTNIHYDQPAEFFATLTGGDWNTYSCNLWEPGATETQSQERKLDRLGELLRLKPGMRVVDVGCGWGGPIVYLAKRFGVQGAGITPSTNQQAFGQRRADRHGVDVKIHCGHWRDFEDAEPFDAVVTDEAIVHFNDLRGFFEKMRDLLKPDGLMLNKELHFTSSRAAMPTRAMVLLNKSFGETGNYRTLHDELRLLDAARFELERLEQIDLWHYEKTLECWVANMQKNRAKLEALVGCETYARFHTYFRILRRGCAARLMTLDLVVARPSHYSA